METVFLFPKMYNIGKFMQLNEDYSRYFRSGNPEPYSRLNNQLLLRFCGNWAFNLARPGSGDK